MFGGGCGLELTLVIAKSAVTSTDLLQFTVLEVY